MAVVAQEFAVQAPVLTNARVVVDVALVEVSLRSGVGSPALADLNSLALAGAACRGCATRERLPDGRQVAVLWLLQSERDWPRRSLSDSGDPTCPPGWA